MVASAPRRKSLGRRIWDARWCYAFLLPGVVLTGLFSLYPIVASWYYSFFDWNGITSRMYYIGLQNYQEIVRDGYFWSAFGRSFFFMAVTVPAEVGLALLVAIVLNDRAMRLAPLFRTLFFIPVVMTTAIMSIVMSFVFAAFNGPVNQALQDLHLIQRPIDWLGNPRTVLWTAIIIFVWKWFGQPLIYWMAALQTVPHELHEAAKVDGAGPWRIIRSITAPLVAPFGAIIVLIIAVGNLQVFAFLQALTNGGPFFASETMELFIYRMAFGASMGSVGTSTRLGYASAAGVLFGICVSLIALPQLGLVSRFRRQGFDVGRAGA